MQGPDFLYFLVDPDGRSYYVEDGIVKVSAVGAPLQFTPGGWKDIVIENVRNQKYFALDRSFTIPISAVEDGALILKDRYYRFGSEVKVALVILELRLHYVEGVEYGYYYDSFYRGDIDFSNFDHKGPVVSVNIMEAGTVRLIKANENKKYKIPLDVPEAVQYIADGVILQSKKNMVVIQGQYDHAVNNAFTTKEMLVTRELNQEGYFFNIGFQSETGSIVDANYSYIDGENLAESDKYNGRTANGSVQFTINLKGTIENRRYTGANQFSTRLGTDFKLETTTGQIFNLFTLNYTWPGQGTKLAFNVTSPPITLPADVRFFIWQVPNANQSGNAWRYLDDVKLSYNVQDRKGLTYVKALKPEYVLKQILKNINNGVDVQFKSDLLAANAHKLLTCGNAIRGLTGTNILTSLSDFHQSMNPQLNTALGIIDGVLRYEVKDFFIRYDDPIDLGEVVGLSTSCMKESLYTSIKIGYPNETFNDVNGKYEFNQTYEYSTAITSDSKELNLIGVYRGDCLGHEYARANFEGIESVDSSSDNDIWIIQCLPTPTVTPGQPDRYTLDRTPNASATGIPNATTYFNIPISPARLMRVMGKYIRSLFYKMDTTQLVFLATDKNEFLTAAGIVENAPITISSLGTPYYTSNLFKFKAPAPLGIVQILNTLSTRAFRFSYLGISMLCVPNNMGIKSGDNEEQEMIMISAPQNDLTQLINITD